jgi:glycosyltransferase involved in cell wall biosynthesis
MRLSIITINYNNYEGLQKTINSVVSQTFKDFEWIIIDGGSTDGSKELIEQYADQFAFWVSEPDKGIYNAMNKGIRVAKGDYLQFLNSGDWLCDETALERCFSNNVMADVLYGDLYLYDKGQKREIVYPETLTLRLFYRRSLCHQSSFIRRELLSGSLYSEENKIVSDWEFFLKQALNNKHFKHINEFVICYDLSGISSNNEELLWAERKRVIKENMPEMLVADYDTMDEWEKLLNEKQIKDVLIFGKKKKLYHKMITAFLSLIRFIDKAFSKERVS